MDNMEHAIEHAARAWHKDSDHAHDGAPFGSPTCNCLSVAKRLAPMLADAWDEGYVAGADPHCGSQALNPYRKGN